MDKNIKKQRGGFTIIETVVALSLFIVAIGFVTGAFIQALHSQRMVNDLMAVNSNVSLVMEQLAREIRAGYNFYVGATCGHLVFTRFRGSATTTVQYQYNESGVVHSLDRAEDDGSVLPDFHPITADNVSVSDACFVVNQASVDAPPRITISIGVMSTNPDLQDNVVHLQTTVSARIWPSEAPLY